MVRISPLGKARNAARSGLRYGFLVANQTTAKTMPCQKMRKTGQMIQYKYERI